MCIIMVKPAGGEMPKEEHLRNGASKNDDGIGLCYRKKDTSIIKIKKDFKDDDELIKFINENVTKEDDLIVHCRLATHGLHDEGNRHPFPVTLDKELIRKVELDTDMAVAHNGIINDFERHTTFSDTQMFVLELLAKPGIKNNIEDEDIRYLLAKFINPDRLAILLGNGNIIMLGKWEKEGDVYYSNSGYKIERWKSSVGSGIGGVLGFHGSGYRSSHWDGYYNKEYPTTKGEFYEKCEGCGIYALVKKATYKDFSGFLCKTCRKDIKKVHDNKKKEVVKCSACLDEHPKSEMVHAAGQQICKACLMVYEN